MENYKIVLDCGHATVTAGKQTPDGVKEWTINDKIANKIASLLVPYNIDIYRVDDVAGVAGDVDVPLQQRTKQIKAIAPQMMLSIHNNANSGQWGNWSGFEIFWMQDDEMLADRAVSFLEKELAKPVNGKVIKRHGDPSKTKNLHMLREVTKDTKALLYEFGYMDSLNDNPYITSEEGQLNCARGVANFIIAELGLTLKPIPKKKYEEIIDKSALNNKEDWKKLIKALASGDFQSDKMHLLKYLDVYTEKIKDVQ